MKCGDFFPLTVDVEAGMYAAGKIPGGFIKRRAGQRSGYLERAAHRSSHSASMAQGLQQRDPYRCHGAQWTRPTRMTFLAVSGASAALSLSGGSFLGPVGAVRVGKVDGQWVINPTYEEIDKSPVNLVVAGTAEAIGMVEAGCEEVGEADMLEGLQVAHEAIKKQVEAIRAWAAEVGAPKVEFVEKLPDPVLVEGIRARFGVAIEQPATYSTSMSGQTRWPPSSRKSWPPGRLLMMLRTRQPRPSRWRRPSTRWKRRPYAVSSPSTRSGLTVAGSMRSGHRV